MASFFADENFPFGVVEALRTLGHDVVRALEVGKANRAIPDEEVLVFATSLGRAALTLDRWQFIRLHSNWPDHCGIVVCSQDADVERQARAIDQAVAGTTGLKGKLLRINPPA